MHSLIRAGNPNGARTMSDPPAAANDEEAPVYVNSKQFHRIMQRRIQREKWRNYFTRTKVLLRAKTCRQF